MPAEGDTPKPHQFAATGIPPRGKESDRRTLFGSPYAFGDLPTSAAQLPAKAKRAELFILKTYVPRFARPDPTAFPHDGVEVKVTQDNQLIVEGGNYGKVFACYRALIYHVLDSILHREQAKKMGEMF